MGQYEDNFVLQEWLERDRMLIDSPDLWPIDSSELFAAMMADAASPLPDGTESPFSSRSPASGHSILLGTIVQYWQLLGHELNLKPKKLLLDWLRLIGIQQNPAEYPIISMTFRRSRSAIQAGLHLVIPRGTEIRSFRNPNLKVYTIEEGRTEGVEELVRVPARLSCRGRLKSLQIGEFSDVPSNIANLVGVGNDGGVVSEGRERESITEMVIRARDGFRTQSRIVTLADYYYYANVFGSLKTRVMRSPWGIAPTQNYGISVAIAVWTGQRNETERSAKALEIQQNFSPLVPFGQPFSVIPAQIIPLDGVIEVEVERSLLGTMTPRNLVAKTIADRINPPYGRWADDDFTKTISGEIDNEKGIYSVPSVRLKNSRTNQPLEQIEIKPHSLFQIQNSLEVRVL